ncbi:MAG: bifunctional UDP-N-acetylglucosamine diphosphorylase/glucosamine-1-phosphate N-acetyltransferase GlmU [Actinomycetota bacterium]
MAARLPRTLAAVVLAAGKGKRLRSRTPKVLHPVAGEPALWHVLQLVLAAKPAKIVVVIGHGGDDVRDAVRSWGLTPAPVFVTQAEQLGTGHAVLAAKRAVGTVDEVLVANGDLDPVRPEDIRALLRRHRRTAAVVTIASADLHQPGGYGRVVRDPRGRVVDVVEGVDATPEIRAITEVATNWMVFRRADLFRALPKLDRSNRQREYYLNRVVPMLLASGERIEAVVCDTAGVMGLNSREGLAAVERLYRGRINAGHMASGVTLVDPSATYIDVGVRIGPDSVIYPNSFIQGASVIGRGCTIGPSTVVQDSTVGDRSEVWFSVVLGSRIGRDVQVGPFVRLRPGVDMADRSRAGAFVDMKEATIGRGSKIPHLSYVGDASIGENVNIGAGSITVNYDGYAKHETSIGDGARIGSDTMLVAPVRIGKGAVTGAGSVITSDVPDGALAVERSDQRTVPGYRTRKDAKSTRKPKGA